MMKKIHLKVEQKYEGEEKANKNVRFSRTLFIIK